MSQYLKTQLDPQSFDSTPMEQVFRILVSSLFAAAGLALTAFGMMTSCGSLLAIGLIHGLGSLTIIGQISRDARRQVQLSRLNAVASIAWCCLTTAAVLTFISSLSLETGSSTDTRWTSVLMIVAGVWFALAQVAGAGGRSAGSTYLILTILYETMALSLISSGVVAFDHSGTSVNSIGGLLIRAWAVALGIDGVVRMTLAFLDGLAPAHALGRIGGLRSVLYGFDQREDLPFDASEVASADSSLRRKSQQTVILASVSLLVVTAWMLTGVVIVGSEERAISFFLGRAEELPLGPGLHFRPPYPLTRIKYVPVGKLQSLTVGFEAAPLEIQSQPLLWTAKHGQRETPFLIGDGTELVAINALVYYRVSEQPKLLTEYATSVADPVTLLKSFAERLLTTGTRSLTLDDLLERDLEEWSEDLSARLHSEVRRAIPGLEILSFNILSVHPPVEVAASFLDQVNARVDATKSHSQAQGEAKAELIRCEMMASTSVADAKAAVSKRMTAIIDETTHQSALATLDISHPQVVRRRNYCESLADALAHKSITVVDAAIPPELRLSLGELSRNARDVRAGLEGQDEQK